MKVDVTLVLAVGWAAASATMLVGSHYNNDGWYALAAALGWSAAYVEGVSK